MTPEELARMMGVATPPGSVWTNEEFKPADESIAMLAIWTGDAAEKMEFHHGARVLKMHLFPPWWRRAWRWVARIWRRR